MHSKTGVELQLSGILLLFFEMKCLLIQYFTVLIPYNHLFTNRSHLLIVNTMPFPIMLSLSNTAWPHDHEFGPIEEGETFGVPLLYAYASGIKFRPASLPCTWTTTIGCSLHIQDFQSIIELVLLLTFLYNLN